MRKTILDVVTVVKFGGNDRVQDFQCSVSQDSDGCSQCTLGQKVQTCKYACAKMFT